MTVAAPLWKRILGRNSSRAAAGEGAILTEGTCEDFAEVGALAELADECGADNRVFKQDAPRWMNAVPQGLATGVNVFGDGFSPPMMSTPRAQTLMHAVSTYACRGATLLPDTGAIVTGQRALLRESIGNSPHFGGIEHADPNIGRAPDGPLLLLNANAIARDDVFAIPCCTVGSSNYGHFFFDALQQAFLLFTFFRGTTDAYIVTGTLTGWQRELFSLLGLDARIREFQTPRRFRHLACSTLTSMHVSYTTRYCRPLYDTLRFNVGTDPHAPRRIYIRRPEGSQRRMINQDDLIAFLEGHAFTVISPERLSVRDQIRMFSNADIVVAQGGAALTNVGFCPPGCEIIEIMPECYYDQWIRSTAFYLAHNWRVVFCAVPESSKYGLKAGAVVHAESGFDFSVDLEQVGHALSVAESSVET